MYKKKIIGIALIAAMVGSMAAVSVSAREAFDGDDTVDNYFENHTVGIVGSMTGWGSSADTPMTDADGDGIYVGVYKDLPAGDHEFKVRADNDGSWTDAWGVYDEEHDRTKNGFEDNLKASTTDVTDLVVMLDTNGDDEVVWPVSAFTTDTVEAGKYGIVGSLTGWAAGDDIPMYEYEEGKFVGIAKDVAAGSVEFKVRAFNDGTWSESYGVYDEENDRTKNGFEDNIKVELDAVSDIVVFFDATGDDDVVWPVSYAVISDNTVVTEEYTGKVDDGEDEPETPVAEPSRYGIVGDLTGWGSNPDYPMYETATKGVYVGKTDALEAGTYQVKVRADGLWDESWGMYDEEKDSTKNGFDDNINVTVEAGSVIFVQIDTTGEDDEVWGLSYAIVTDETAEPDWQYVGKPQKEEESKPEESKPEESKPEESSEPDTSVPVDEPSQPEVYETKITDYIYFDNSQTKWNEVYAYWWHTDYARTYDFQNNDWGIQKKVNEDGTEGWEPVPFPGTKMTQIEGTDIWQIRVPFNAHKIIFNCGFTDDQIKGLNPADDPSVIVYQTGDIAFDAAENAGQVYTVEGEATPGRGVYKAKYTYKTGAFSTYTGVYAPEQIGEAPVVDPSNTEEPSKTEDPSTVVPEPSNTQPSQQTQPSQTQPTQNSTQTSTTTPINTGDATMPIAVAVVAALALGTAVVASRKKVEE